MIGVCLAYIDPGTGSIVAQFMAGAVVGMGLLFRRTFGRVAAVLWRVILPASRRVRPAGGDSTSG